MTGCDMPLAYLMVLIYSCQEPSCKYSVRSESRYKEHYKYFHRSSKTVKCRDCNQWFQTPSDRNNCKKANADSD